MSVSVRWGVVGNSLAGLGSLFCTYECLLVHGKLLMLELITGNQSPTNPGECLRDTWMLIYETRLPVEPPRNYSELETDQ